MDGVKLTLDCAQAEFLTPERAVISLKGGELYVLTLIADAMRTVRGFNFDRSAASVLTTCLTVLDQSYLFLGSRLGNSLLLQFTEKDKDSVHHHQTREQPPLKKKKIESDENDFLASDVGDIHDIDLEVYGTRMEEIDEVTNRITSYNFEVCDSILNVGPCGHVAMGEPAFLSEELKSNTKADPDIELVSTSGHGKNGALCVLQQTVRPQILSTYPLPGVTDMWTVCQAKDEHSFLILSRTESTMVLQTDHEITELEQSGFYTAGPTVYCGNMGGKAFIIQVTANALRLLNGSQMVQTMDLDFKVYHVSNADPYIVLLTEVGLVLVTLESNHELRVVKANLKSKSKVVAACAYKDESGLFSTETPEEMESIKTSSDLSSKVAKDIVDDEDELLYGESAPSLFEKEKESSLPKFKDNDNDAGLGGTWKRFLSTPPATFWSLALRENGSLEIMSLPDFTLKYLIPNFHLAPNVLTDALFTSLPSKTSSITDPENQMPKIQEIKMVALGERQRRPLLMARTSDQELIMYQVFPYYDNDKLDKTQLKMRFKRLAHGLILRERKSKSKKDKQPRGLLNRCQIRYFSDIAGYEGVFLCGQYPHWLFLSGRGELRTHPMSIDSSIPCFSAFHNVNCPQGFIYFNRKGELRICVLPNHMKYDAPWPVRKVPLRCTPHFVAYHLESKTYSVVTSTAETTSKVWKFNGDDKELVSEERDPRFPYPSIDSFHLQLFSPISWEAIPGTKLTLDDYERCTGMKHLYLTSEGLHSGEKGYIVCSTAYCYGEDVTPRGYIRIYDIIEVNPEPGQPLTKNKIKSVYDKEQKGPITAVDAVNGFLVAAVGQKIYVFQFKNQDLFGVAFIDSQIYIHSLATMKNFILVGDVMKSVDLLQFQKDYRTLAVISRDPRKCEVFSVEFIVDNTTLGFAVTDADKNVLIYMYQPEARESNGGQKLVRKADFHLGQNVNHMFRVRAKITDPSAGGRLLTGNIFLKNHILSKPLCLFQSFLSQDGKNDTCFGSPVWMVP